jgi:hypothetical protein
MGRSPFGPVELVFRVRFFSHMQRLDRMVEVDHDHLLLGPIEETARKLDQEEWALTASKRSNVSRDQIAIRNDHS